MIWRIDEMSRRAKDILKENNELEKQLSDDGKKVLTDIVVYLRGVPVSMYEQEKVRRDITQMLIDGEKRGNSSKEVIGEDYREFCDSIVAEIPHMSRKEKVLVFIRDTLPALIVLLVIWCAGRLMEIQFGALTSFDCPVTLGNLLGGILVLTGAEGLITLLTRYAFDSSRSFNMKWGAVLVVVFIAAVCVNYLFTYKVFSIHLGVAAVLALAVFIVYRMVDLCVD